MSGAAPMTTPAAVPEGVYMLEQPFLRAPNESLRRQFRAMQKHVERDMTGLKNNARELSKKGGQSQQDAIAALDAMIAKVEGLKQKLSDVHEKGTTPNIAALRSRSHHLDELEKMDESEQELWMDTRLDRWLVDWSLRHGHARTAAAIAEQRKIEDFVDTSLFAEVTRIEQALAAKSCTEALAWCSDNKNALRKNKCTLEFELRLQEFIELARNEKSMEAFVYWRKHLQPWQETHLARIQQAAGLLAMSPSRKCKSYQKYYSEQRWTALVHFFRKAIYQLHALPISMHRRDMLQRRLPRLRCVRLGVLAKEVPFSHHGNSTIVCRISGKIMNEDNPPLAFSNGNVYSSEALKEMAAKHNGKVKCPRTGIEQELSSLQKVYIT
ncbi:Protein FYV10 [Serendipita indica DSM 11827]|nr:Protein FYV10 [Serendipita indica DSM 11827]